MTIQCVRCVLKPAVYEFLCVDCLYDDYDVAHKKWGEWQALAEAAIRLLMSGVADFSEVEVVIARMRELRGQPPG